ncbi:MAG: RsmB/NOP family class I SAM-dependent RNA methyltransferase [bacterium]
MDAIDHAAAVLRMFEIEPQPLDRLIERYFKRHREIGSRDRRIISQAAFGVMRWRRRIDAMLLMSGISKPTNRVRALAFTAAGELDAQMPRDFPGGAAAFYSFPDFLYEKFVSLYGASGAARMVEALSSPSRPCLRVNSALATRAEAIEMLAAEGVKATPTERSPFGIRLERRIDLRNIAAYTKGIVEVQDESSQLAVLAADPSPGEMVLDACAGGGGKSLMIAMLMEGRGRVIASDIDAARLRELKRRAARARLSNIDAIPEKELDVRAAKHRDKCDLVFIDAPCSGTGTLRRNPDLKWRLTDADIEQRVSVQIDLLKRYGSWVRPGGRFVYATCSMLREENEDVVARFLQGRGFRLIDVNDAFARRGIDSRNLTTSQGFFNADPREGEWDGFFAAAMVRA